MQPWVKKWFLIYDNKIRLMKEKTDKLNIKSKTFCDAKDTIKKVKGDPWNERIFVRHVSDKGLVSRI